MDTRSRERRAPIRPQAQKTARPCTTQLRPPAQQPTRCSTKERAQAKLSGAAWLRQARPNPKDCPDVRGRSRWPGFLSWNRWLAQPAPRTARFASNSPHNLTRRSSYLPSLGGSNSHWAPTGCHLSRTFASSPPASPSIFEVSTPIGPLPRGPTLAGIGGQLPRKMHVNGRPVGSSGRANTTRRARCLL